jgi:glutamate decarboxylase
LSVGNALIVSKLIERLVNDLIGITEDLIKRDSPMHALDALGSAQSTKHHEREHGKLDDGHGSASSGTYAKTC